MSWMKHHHQKKVRLALGCLTLSGTIAIAAENLPDAPTSSSAPILASEPQRIQQIIENEKQIQKLIQEKQELYSTLSPDAKSSVSAVDSTLNRQDRIRQHQERIKRIIDESRRRSAESKGETVTQALQTSGPAMSRSARIQEHQDRLQHIMDESRLRRAAQSESIDLQTTQTGNHFEMKVSSNTNTAASGQTMEERRKKIEETRRQLEAYIKAQNDDQK